MAVISFIPARLRFSLRAAHAMELADVVLVLQSLFHPEYRLMVLV
jgi:hypothetical protein